MLRFSHKLSYICAMFILMLLFCSCAGNKSTTVSGSVDDTLAMGSLTAGNENDVLSSDESDDDKSNAGNDTQSSSNDGSTSSAESTTEEEIVFPEYVMYAMLKSSALPTFKEVDLNDKKTDLTESDITQIDFALTPIGFTSLDSDTGLMNNGLVTVSTKEITLLSNNLPKGYEDGISSLNEQAKAARDRYELVLSSLQNTKNKTEYFRYGEILDLIPCRMDSLVLSVIQIRRITAEGGGLSHASGNPALSFNSVNIDGKSGDTLLLTDVVKNTDELALLAAELLYQTYVTSVPYQGAASLFTEKELQSAITKMLANEKESSVNGQGADFAWSPSYLGLRLFFNASVLSRPDTLESYRTAVSGCRDLDTFEIIIPYRYAPTLFVSSYTALPKDFIAKLQPGAAYAFDFEGTLVPFRMTLPMEEDNLKNASFTGMYNLCMEQLDMDIPVVSSNLSATTGAAFYLVRSNGNCYLYVQQLTTEQNGAKLQVYKYTKSADLCYFELVGVSDDMLDPAGVSPLNPTHFRSRRRANILPDPIYGRMSNLDRTVYVSDNGLPGSDDTYFDVEGDFVRTTAVDLNLEVLVDFEKELTETKLFPAGTKLTMFRAQLIPYTQADFTTQDGEVIRLHVNGVDAIDNVDGHMVEEAFK